MKIWEEYSLNFEELARRNIKHGTKKEYQLKVVEALQDDAYKGVARIDSEIMRELDIRRGDPIMIKGGRETIAIADRAYPADVGEGIIRIDGILEKKCKDRNRRCCNNF